ncbi:MAG: DUF3102 domain-containing protein [Snowella sp.]
MSSFEETKKFDYASLDLDTAQFIREQTGEIRGLMRRTAQDIFEIGHKLLKVKAKLGHGRFGTWLAVEFDWTERTAQQFMNVARQFKAENFSDLQLAPSALYLLAAPSTPPKVRQEAIARAELGETITYKTAKAIKQEYKNAQSLPAVPSPRSSLPLEIVSLRSPKETPTETPAEITSQPSVLRESRDWYQLGQHFLYRGHPQNKTFLERLPKDIAMAIAFPSKRPWQWQLPQLPKSELTFFSNYQDIDLQTLTEMVRLSFLLYSESRDTVIFAFLPTPQLLLLAHSLDCSCWIADPDPQRHEATIAAWETTPSLNGTFRELVL